jgi:hypothetical protein
MEYRPSIEAKPKDEIGSQRATSFLSNAPGINSVPLTTPSSTVGRTATFGRPGPLREHPPNPRLRPRPAHHGYKRLNGRMEPAARQLGKQLRRICRSPLGYLIRRLVGRSCLPADMTRRAPNTRKFRPGITCLGRVGELLAGIHWLGRYQ